MRSNNTCCAHKGRTINLHLTKHSPACPSNTAEEVYIALLKNVMIRVALLLSRELVAKYATQRPQVRHANLWQEALLRFSSWIGDTDDHIALTMGSVHSYKVIDDTQYGP